MTKMKLAPIELDKTSLRKGTKVYKQSVNPFVASRLYAAYEEMTAECPTVEVVLDTQRLLDIATNLSHPKIDMKYAYEVAQCIGDYLTANGYKIIKEVE
jgi:hypothetical protein